MIELNRNTFTGDVISAKCTDCGTIFNFEPLNHMCSQSTHDLVTKTLIHSLNGEKLPPQVFMDLVHAVTGLIELHEEKKEDYFSKHSQKCNDENYFRCAEGKLPTCICATPCPDPDCECMDNAKVGSIVYYGKGKCPKHSEATDTKVERKACSCPCHTLIARGKTYIYDACCYS